jgi:hypothetical protein
MKSSLKAQNHRQSRCNDVFVIDDKNSVLIEVGRHHFYASRSFTRRITVPWWFLGLCHLEIGEIHAIKDGRLESIRRIQSEVSVFSAFRLDAVVVKLVRGGKALSSKGINVRGMGLRLGPSAFACFEPCANAWIEYVRPTAPEIRSQRAFDSQVIQLQLNCGNALRKISPGISLACMQLKYPMAFAFGFDSHTAPFGWEIVQDLEVFAPRRNTSEDFRN